MASVLCPETNCPYSDAASGASCGDRITWLLETGNSATAALACARVAKAYPNTCGDCAPASSSAGPTVLDIFVAGPGAGPKAEGACRTDSGSGSFDEVWDVTEDQCKEQCAMTTDCVGIEFAKLKAYSRCEIHYERITSVLPVQGYTCWIKQ
jgi:hypothetical protein